MEILPVTGRLVLVTIEGFDVGELGEWPFEVLERDLACEGVDLFIDARHARGASMTASSAWAIWLKRHRNRLRSVTMLARARVVQLTAAFVRRFSGIESLMQVTHDEAVFDSILAFATRPGSGRDRTTQPVGG